MQKISTSHLILLVNNLYIHCYYSKLFYNLFWKMRSFPVFPYFSADACIEILLISGSFGCSSNVLARKTFKIIIEYNVFIDRNNYYTKSPLLEIYNKH